MKIKVSQFESNFIGLWYDKKFHKYKSQVFDLSALRDFKGNIRIIMYKDKYHKKGDNRPTYNLQIIGADAEAKRTFVLTEVEDKFIPGEIYLTAREAFEIAVRGADSIRSGYDAYDVYAQQDFENAETAVIIPEYAS